MKRRILLFTFLIIVFCGYSQSSSISLRFTAQHACAYAELDSILIENHSRGGSMMLFYPDTVATLTITSIDVFEDEYKSLFVSQNYPNPFAVKTFIDVFVPETDEFSVAVYDLLGRKVADYRGLLQRGMHSFSFYASSQQTYLLVVTSKEYKQQRVMIQLGKGANTSSRIEYNGELHQRKHQFEPSVSYGTKSILLDGFSFEEGDELKYTGYLTNSFGDVDFDIKTDSPTSDTDYVFDIANAVPEKSSEIIGSSSVFEDETGLAYHVDEIPGLIYNWSVPAGWDIVEGQGTSSILVNVGSESGNITVTAENACGISEETILPITMVLDEGKFIFVVETTADQTVYQFLVDNAVNLQVDWGDGNSEVFNGNVKPMHEYGEAGTWTIKVSGQASRISFWFDWIDTYPPMLRDILTPLSQGISGITSAQSMFYGTKVESFSRHDFFDEASANVTDMRNMFMYSDFNQPIGNWDVGNVTEMSSMFLNTPFNQDIGTWDVSSVTQMIFMFYSSNFNQDIGSWNVSKVENMSDMFYRTPFNQDISGWDVGKVKNMSSMFAYSEFNQNIGIWNVENVTRMSDTFRNSPFNQDICSWNVGKVTNMSNTFNSTPFNQDLSSWDVSNVTNMDGMFMSSNFNQDISGWDVSIVNNMNGMFAGTPFNHDIGVWNVGNVTNMSGMFWVSPFNHDIGAWDVSKVTDMEGMFHYSSFNHNISAWDVSNVQNFDLFLSGTNFSTENYDRILTQWSYLNLKENVVFNVGDAMYSLGLPEERRQHLIDNLNWTITDGGNTDQEFGLLNLIVSFSPTGSGRVIGGGNYEPGEQVTITALPNTFYKFLIWEAEEGIFDDDELAQTTFAMPNDHASIVAHFSENPDEENVFVFVVETTADQTEYKFLLDNAVDFNVYWEEGPIEKYNGNVQPVHDFGEAGVWTIRVKGKASRLAFSYATKLRDILTPVSDGVKGLVNANSMFKGLSVASFSCVDFFDDASGGITDMRDMFYGAAYNQDISNWDVGQVTNMSSMFRSSSFNQSLSQWDVSSVDDMGYMFSGSAFNGDVAEWNVGNVTSMQHMFTSTPFNQDVSQWDVGQVNNMSVMFYQTNFNQDISLWNVSNVTDMGSMFTYTPFNQDIGQWDVSNVTKMSSLFACTPFNQDISNWDVSSVVNFNSFLYDGQLSIQNYDKLLINWSYLDLVHDINFNAGSSRYSLGLPLERRQYIIDEFGWVITDGGDARNQLTLVVNPDGAGSVEGEGLYLEGEKVEVSVTANEGFRFINWTDQYEEEISDQLAFEYTMPDEGMILKANFVPLYTLALTVNDELGGSVDGEGEYAQGDEIVITASVSEGYRFTFWTGDVEYLDDTNSPEASVTMPAKDIELTANFSKLYTLTLVSNPTFGGMAQGEGVYIQGEAVDISAEANPLFTFTNWEAAAGSFANSSSANTKFVMPGDDATVTANFSDFGCFKFVIETTIDQTNYQFVLNGAVNIEVLWGDETYEEYNGNVNPSYDFGEAGTWVVRVRGQASRLAFFTGGSTCSYAPMLRDILTPISDGITGLNSGLVMFRGTQVESFTASNFFDGVSSGITNMNSMFQGSVFNQDISNWDVSNVLNMYGMFQSAKFNQNINGWNLSKVTTMKYMFWLSEFNQPLNSWNVSSVMDMSWMFGGSAFNQPIGSWNVVSVEDMSHMFRNSHFNQDISGWNVISVKDMTSMFTSNSVFNQPLNSWNVSNVETMRGMFTNSVFNQDIGLWNVSSVTNMSEMFNASQFNQSINDWNVINVNDMSTMFQSSVYNQPLNSWDVGNVENMSSMFNNSAFNQDISSWNVGSVSNMSYMFNRSVFNQPIGGWNVSTVINMMVMFNESSFNQDIGGWNVSNVTNMNGMFRQTPFDQDISNWNVSKVINFNDFLQDAELSTGNYNSLLIKWSDLILSPSINFNAGNSRYDLGLPANRRQCLIDEFGWTIYDGGETGEEYIE